MADNDNRELMEFLEKQFKGIENQFKGVGEQFKDVREQFKDVRGQFKDVREQFKGVNEQIEGVNKRLDNTASKDDLANFATKDDLKAEIAAAKEEIMRHAGILNEDTQHKLDLLVEGRTATHERIERDKEENVREHGQLEKMTFINTSDISKLDQRMGRLEGNV